MRAVLVLLLCAVALASPFSYLCTGKNADTCAPRWGKLKVPDNECHRTNRQSPIDLPEFSKATCGIHKFSVFPHYEPLRLCETKVENNGHTVTVHYPKSKRDSQGELVWNGVKYNLVQFHFHTPAEHTINGVSYPFELHLVHKKCSSGRRGSKHLVIGILFQEKSKGNRVLRHIFRNLPKFDGKKTFLRGSKVPNDVVLDLNNLFKHQEWDRYFTYPGSLTTPPCSENVRWIVVAKPKRISRRQVARFAAVMPEKINNRPVQPTGSEQRGRVHASCTLADKYSPEPEPVCVPKCVDSCTEECPQTCSVRCPRIKKVRKGGEWVKPKIVPSLDGDKKDKKKGKKKF